MDLWTFRRYDQPELLVDTINVDEEAAAITLSQAGHDYRMALDDPDAARQVAGELRSLESASAPLWGKMRASPIGEGWGAIGEFLDQRSLIRERNDTVSNQLVRRRQDLVTLVQNTADALLAGLAEPRRMDLARAARCLKAVGPNSPTQDCWESAAQFDPSHQPNFFAGLIASEFEYFRRFAPLTLAACDALLTIIAGEDDSQAEPWATDEYLAIYDVRDLESHLWLIGQCLLASTGDNAARMPLPALSEPDLCSGLEFMRRIEVMTRTVLREWGENPYVTALDALNDQYAPLVAGPFIEQYHVTRRFVEIIAPLLSKRLSPPLRAMMFRYFSEEVGHEALESTTCEALGVSPSALDNTIPLPLHFGFVDMLTFVAAVDPMASFASVMVIEGVFGEPPKMSLRLAAVARTNPAFDAISDEHEELNETLNHNSISRDAFQHIVAVPPATQKRVMNTILFLLELNHRAWRQITDFYGPLKELRLHGRLGRSFLPK